MLKKIVGLSLVCVIMLAVTVAGTWAFLSDTGKVSQTPIKAAKLNLLTGTSPDGGITVNYSSGLTASINVTNLKPSQSTPPVTIYLKNDTGNIYGSKMNISFKYTKSDGNQNGTPVITTDSVAAILKVTSLDYDRDIISSGLVTDWNGNGYIDMQDLMTATNSPNSQLNGLGGINSGQSRDFVIQLQMQSTDQYGNPIANINDFQGDGLNITILFTLTQ